MVVQLSQISRFGAWFAVIVMSMCAASRAFAQGHHSKSLSEQPLDKSSTQSSEKARKQSSEKATKKPSIFFPDWKPTDFNMDLRPVLGFQYSSDSLSETKTGQAEIGLHAAARGIDLVSGNPGMEAEPSLGYALGFVAVQKAGEREKSGRYNRIWGGIQTPIYYKFVRQLFGANYGIVSGGPIPLSRRFQLVSDTGIKVLPHVSAHYTLTYDRSFGDKSVSPEFNSYDHWLHGRLAASFLSFYVDAGPGYSTSKMSINSEAQKFDASSSETYVLARSGFDLLTNKIGFDAQAKYIIAATTENSFVSGSARSPLDDLGADARRVGLPEDSFHASAFFGIRQVVAGFGIGWRYTLEILNMNERNNTKRRKTESNGLGIFASLNF